MPSISSISPSLGPIDGGTYVTVGSINVVSNLWVYVDLHLAENEMENLKMKYVAHLFSKIKITS
jgi:hypothetical protein